MQGSWKAMILLGLAFVAIQYTAIWMLTFKSFQLCPVPQPQDCGMGAPHMDPSFECGCEYPYLVYNATRKTHILLLATTRSGSSFVGQLLSQHPDVFYLFEPLYHVHATLSGVGDRVKLGASRDLLRSLYSCDLHYLESYIQPPPKNHTTNDLFRRGSSKALCSQPVCDAFGPGDANVEESDCTAKCGALNMTLASESCLGRQHVAIKVVRVPEISDLQALVEDPRFNLKVIQLVRDPRGILASRMDAFKDKYQLWTSWKATGIKPENQDLLQMPTCDDFLRSVSTGLGDHHWLKGKYMLVRYEDLAQNPLQKAKEIYDYLGLSMDKNMMDLIEASTNGSKKPSGNQRYSTVRDAAANAESWRLKLPFEMVDHMQTLCEKVLNILGYKTAHSAEELKNMTLSLVQDKSFVPFL